MKTNLIYLAQPYHSEDPVVVDERGTMALDVTRRMLSAGYAVFSPIVYGLTIQGPSNEPRNWDVEWAKFGDLDLAILEGCREVMVLDIPGWRESRGVQIELQYAESRKIPVRFLNPVSLAVYDRPVTSSEDRVRACDAELGRDYISPTGHTIKIVSHADGIHHYKGVSVNGLTLSGWVPDGYMLRLVDLQAVA